MNDAEFEAAKERIKAIIDIWHSTLGLNWWHMTYEYSRDGMVSQSEGNNTCLGMARVLWQYQTACLTFNVPALEGETDAEIERVVLHEMMHVFLNETRGDGDDWDKHEDRVASTLTSAIIWTRDMQNEEAKDGEIS